MKKFLSILIVLAMLIGMAPAVVFADSANSTVDEFVVIEFGVFEITPDGVNQVLSDDNGKQNSITIINMVKEQLDRANDLYVDGSIAYESVSPGTANSKVIQITNNAISSAEGSRAYLLGDEGKAYYGHYVIDLSVWESGEGSNPGIASFYAEFDYVPMGTEAKLTYHDGDDEDASANKVAYGTMADLIVSANEDGGEIVLFDDVEDPGNEPITAEISVDASGYKIGSQEKPLQVNGYIDFYNLAGTFYVKAMSYDETLISIYEPEVGAGLNHIELSLGDAPQTFCYGSILYFWDYDDADPYPSVSLKEPGYFALQGQYGSIRIVKTIDYPYAVLNGNGDSIPYSFNFYSTISEAFAAAGSGNVYVTDYVMLGDNSYEINTYNLAGSLTTEQIAQLKTMVRVTDGSKSDFYTYRSDDWNFLYSNAESQSFNLDNASETATINAIGGAEKASAGVDGVVVTTNSWANATDSILSPGSYIIKEGGADSIEIDASSASLESAPTAYTLVSQNANAELSIKGNVSEGKSNVTFNILGDYKEITIDNAEVKLGENLDYKVEGEIPTKVESLVVKGSSFLTVGNEADDYVASIGHVELGAETGDSIESSFDNVLFAPTDAVGFAIGISPTSYAFIYNSDIKMTADNASEDNVCGIINFGMLGLMDTGIDISDENPQDYVHGIWNHESATMILDNTDADKSIKLSKGVAIASEGGTEDLTSSISGVNIIVGGLNPDGAAMGIYQDSGRLLLKPGYGVYDDTYGESINIKVEDNEGYGLCITDDVAWSIAGPKDSVTVDAANAIYAASTKSYGPRFSDYNITTGKYLGGIDIAGAYGIQGLKKAMPPVNYYAKAISGGYEVVYEEYELHKYLMSEGNAAGAFVLHSNIEYGWGELFSLATTYYNSYMPYAVTGNKAIDMNGYRIDSYTKSLNEGLVVVPGGSSLWLYTTKPNAITGNEICVHNGYPVVAVTPDESGEGGGKFVNGAASGLGKYGVNLVCLEEESEDTISLIQTAGRVDLYGGTYNGMVECGFGAMNIYGGNYHGLLEVFADEPGSGVNIYGGRFYPALALTGDEPTEMIVIMNMTGLMEVLEPGSFVYRTIQWDKDAWPELKDKDGDDGKDILPKSHMMAAGTKLVAHGGTVNETCIVLAEVASLVKDPRATEAYAEVVGYINPQPHSGGGSEQAKPVEPTEPVEPETSDFSDVSKDEWFYENVEYVLSKGLMKGVSSTSFDPNGTTTRAMMMTILARMDGCDTEGGEEWYSIGLNWAKNNGISDGTNPTGNITREQFATMLYNYAKTQGEGFTDSWMFNLDFSDAANVSSWANEAMHWCVMKGIINGKASALAPTALDPQGLLTRAEAAAMIQRFCELDK